jgi:hypothetical protein
MTLFRAFLVHIGLERQTASPDLWTPVQDLLLELQERQRKNEHLEQCLCLQ